MQGRVGTGDRAWGGGSRISRIPFSENTSEIFETMKKLTSSGARAVLEDETVLRLAFSLPLHYGRYTLS